MQQFFRPCLALIAATSFAFAAPSREMVQLQRDVALLQEQIRQLQGVLTERMTALQTLVQQSLETSSKTNTSVAVLESGLRDRLSQQLSGPITGVSSKVDQMATEFQGVRENVSSMNETLAKLQAQIIDLSNAVKVLQTPAAPPPGGGPGGGGYAAGGPPAGMSAKQLYDSSMADRSRGNQDLAYQGFEQFLKWYGDSELAPNAQFYLGYINYEKADYSNAIRAFDLVLEKYGENNKSADAHFMKGMALLKDGQKTKAGQEFLTVIQKYPNSEVAAKARAQRKALGLSVPAASAAPARGGARKR